MKPKALIVDDIPLSVDLLEEYIKNQFEVKTAFNGQSALDLLLEYKPDIIFLDIVMPEMGGVEVCNKIRKQSSQQDIYIVMVSGQTVNDEIEKALEAGANAYITKPFTRKSIKPEIEKFFETQVSTAR